MWHAEIIRKNAQTEMSNARQEREATVECHAPLPSRNLLLDVWLLSRSGQKTAL
jgi:hypothetical protein